MMYKYRANVPPLIRSRGKIFISTTRQSQHDLVMHQPPFSEGYKASDWTIARSAASALSCTHIHVYTAKFRARAEYRQHKGQAMMILVMLASIEAHCCYTSLSPPSCDASSPHFPQNICYAGDIWLSRRRLRMQGQTSADTRGQDQRQQ